MLYYSCTGMVTVNFTTVKLEFQFLDSDGKNNSQDLGPFEEKGMQIFMLLQIDLDTTSSLRSHKNLTLLRE